LQPPDPGCLARSKPWRPCINVLLGISADRRGRNGVGTGTDTEGER
jgi:hypothetical protein